MRHCQLSAFIAAVLAGLLAPSSAGAAIPVAEVKRDMPVDFGKEILPVFTANCLACHNRTKAKADLVLETPTDILKGGESGPAVMPGKGAESLLLKVSAHQQEPEMPPKDNKVAAKNLTPEQLGLLKLWIDQGATGRIGGGAGAGGGPSVPSLQLQPLPDGLNAIYALALSPDGQYAACGRGSRIHVYHLPTRSLVAHLHDPSLKPAAHRDLVQSLAFSPDGQLLASGSYREIKLWRRPRDVRRWTVASAGKGAVTTSAISPDGKTLALAGADGVIRFHNPATGERTRELPGHSGAVQSIRFSPDGTKLAAASADKTICVWNVADGTPLAQAASPAEPFAVTWVTGGKQLAVGSADHVIRIWKLPDAAGAPLAPAKELKGHGGPVTSLDSMAPAGAQLLSGSLDGTVRVWNVEGDSAQPIRQMDHGGPVAAVAARPDGKRFASAGLNNVAKLWDAEGKPVAGLKGEKYATELARRKEREVALAAGNVAYQQSVTDGAQKHQAAQIERVKKAALALVEAEKAVAEKQKALEAEKEKKEPKQQELTKAQTAKGAAEDELRLAIRSAQSAADALAEAQAAHQLADAEHKKLQADLPPIKDAAAQAEKPLRAVCFSPDGTLVAAAGDDQLVHTWSVESGAALDTFKGHGAAVATLAFIAPNALLSASADGASSSWNLTPEWVLERTIGPADVSDAASAPADRVNAVDFSPDGRWLAAGGGVPTREGEVLLYDVNTGALQKKLDRVHSDAVLGLAFSPDGKFLATAAADRFLKVLDPTSGKVAKSFEGHTGHVQSVAWKGNGRTLATGGADNVIKVWDFTSGAQSKSISGFEKEVTAVRFVGDKDEIIATAGDGKVRLVKDSGPDVRTFPGTSGFMYTTAAMQDGGVVLAGGEDGVLRWWKGTDGAPVTTFAPPSAGQK